MQLQPYHRVEPLPPMLPPRAPSEGYGNYSNGIGNGAHTAGHGGYPAPHESIHHPTMMHVMGKLIRERWRLLGIWLIVTGVFAAVVVKKFGKPMWRAEGVMLHSPEYNVTGGRRYYTPPSIQTVLMHIKSRDVLTAFKQEFNLSETVEELEVKTNISINKQSELISVTFDWPIREDSEKMTARLMTLAIDHYNTQLRAKLVSEATAAANNAEMAEAKQFDALKKEMAQTLRKNHVTDIDSELMTERADVVAARNDLKKEKSEQKSLEKQLETSLNTLKLLKRTEESQPAKTDESAFTAEEKQLMNSIRQGRQQMLERKKQKKINELNLQKKKAEYVQILKLWEKGFETTQNKESLRYELRALELELDQDKDLQKELLELEATEKKLFETAGARSTAPIQVQQTRIDELRQRLSACPGKIQDVEESLQEKEESLHKKEELKLQVQDLGDRIKQKEKDLTDARQNKQQHDYLLTPNSADLRIQSPATVESSPRSTNAIKLALGTFVVSIALFLSYMFLIVMPRHSSSGEATANRFGIPVLAHQPSPNGNHQPEIPPVPQRPAVSAAGKRETQLETLAAQITQSVQEPGSIVLFTPVSRRMNIESMIADLAQQFAQLGERVLLFDARPGNPLIPTWAGPNAAAVQDRVIQFLEGTNDRAAGCFTPTKIASLDYCSANLTEHLNGLISVYRFRKLAEEMRDRYSLVLMIAPDLEYIGDDEDYLSIMAEGVVLVLNEDTNPAEVEGYIRNLRSSQASVYGAVVMK